MNLEFWAKTQAHLLPVGEQYLSLLPLDKHQVSLMDNHSHLLGGIILHKRSLDYAIACDYSNLAVVPMPHQRMNYLLQR